MNIGRMMAKLLIGENKWGSESLFDKCFPEKKVPAHLKYGREPFLLVPENLLIQSENPLGKLPGECLRQGLAVDLHTTVDEVDET